MGWEEVKGKDWVEEMAVDTVTGMEMDWGRVVVMVAAKVADWGRVVVMVQVMGKVVMEVDETSGSREQPEIVERLDIKLNNYY